MLRRLPALILTLCCGLAGGQSADPSKSAECHQALQALQAQEDVVVAEPGRVSTPPEAGSTPTTGTPLLALRHQAARACLGGNGDPPPLAHRYAQQPIVVSPIRIARPAPPPPITPVPSVGAVPRPVPPLTITHCDAHGCFASDGSRLNRVGSGLVGPNGVCTPQGTGWSCP